MTYVIDIDDTIIFSEIKDGKYCMKSFDEEEIKAINQRYDDGHTIIFHTGRGWNHYNITKEQLEICGLKYHELICGKPVGIYVDKDSVKSIKDAP